MTVGERAKIDANIAQLKEIATKYGGEKTINSIIEQLEEFKKNCDGMNRVFKIKHHIREQIAYFGCYCNEHPWNKGAYNIYLLLCKFCFK